MWQPTWASMPQPCPKSRVLSTLPYSFIDVFIHSFIRSYIHSLLKFTPSVSFLFSLLLHTYLSLSLLTLFFFLRMSNSLILFNISMLRLFSWNASAVRAGTLSNWLP